MAKLLSTEDFGPGGAYDGWTLFWQNALFEWQSRRPVTNASFSGAIHRGTVGRMEMLVIRQSDHQVSKICSGAGSTDARYIVTHQIAGTCSIRQGRNQGEMQLGDVAIVDTEMPVHFDYRNNCTQLNLTLPKDALWSPGERRSLEPGRVIPALGLGHFLGSFLQSCFRSSQSAIDLSDAEAVAIERAFVELLSVTATGGMSAAPAAVRSHLVLLQQWIDRHLGDPELTPQRIAQCYGISVRHLHRLFEPSGETVTQWIEHRRLETCYKELSDSRHAGATITDIALSWGFRDVSHFSRAFRRKYHISPRDHRRAAAAKSLVSFENQPANTSPNFSGYLSFAPTSPGQKRP